MGILDNLFKGTTFQNRQQKVESKEVLIRESIIFTKVFEKDFETWMQKEMHKGLLDYLKECIDKRKSDPSATVNLYFHQSTNSNGFYFRAESPWTIEDYRFFIYLVIRKLKELQYVQNHAIREVTEENEIIKVHEEFFLKPSLQFRKETPYQQLFGNVFIDHQIKGESTELIKFMVNTYTDQNFKKAFDFEDFLSELCLY